MVMAALYLGILEELILELSAHAMPEFGMLRLTAPRELAESRRLQQRLVKF